MDEADIAERNRAIIDQANLYQSHKDEPEGQANGACWFCGESVAPGRRWCSKACCDDWQRDSN